MFSAHYHFLYGSKSLILKKISRLLDYDEKLKSLDLRSGHFMPRYADVRHVIGK